MTYVSENELLENRARMRLREILRAKGISGRIDTVPVARRKRDAEFAVIIIRRGDTEAYDKILSLFLVKGTKLGNSREFRGATGHRVYVYLKP